jgi:hypothetical protein
VRCPLKNCDKLFRSEYLLMMHVKHYHTHYYHLVGNSPSVTDMAFHRTRLGENLDKVRHRKIVMWIRIREKNPDPGKKSGSGITSQIIFPRA